MTTPAQDGKSISALAVDLFGSIDERLSNHGRALSSTMQDLAQVREDLAEVSGDVATIKATQAAHTEALQRIEAALAGLAERG